MLLALAERRLHTDWSTRKALNLSGPTNDLHNALRCEVEAQRNEYLRGQFAGDAIRICAITAEPLTPATAHVDHHDPTFGQIVREFLEREGLGTRLALPELTDSGTRRYLADRALAARWQDHHRQRAVLRLTTAEANLRRKRGPRADGRLTPRQDDRETTKGRPAGGPSQVVVLTTDARAT